MKNKFLLLLYFLPTLLVGQAINHFQHPDSKWNVAKTYPHADPQHPNFAETKTTVYGIKGDTLINTKSWLKLYSSSDSMFGKDFVYKGLVRSENNKVMYMNTSNKLDTIYDFNLKVGDSASYNFEVTGREKIPVIAIDTIVLNGKKYKRFKFGEPKVTSLFTLRETWIEGIGSIHGPLFPTNAIKFSGEIPDSLILTCTKSDNQQIWKHPSYKNCYVNIVLGMGDIKAGNFKLYPNPFTDQIVIENDKSEMLEVSIINGLGQIVKMLKMNTRKEILDLSDINPGVYVIIIQNEKNKFSTKLVKNSSY